MLTFIKKEYESASMNGESNIPSLMGMENVQQKSGIALDEDDGLYIGYGYVSGVFPYKMQDMYDRELKKVKLETAVLENEYLRAEFLPDYGGKLWSLYDKVEKKELLFKNPVIRPCNLALRNAWLSGGVEWNCGMVGHGPFTCSRIFVAEAKLDDGTPVLRMYEFERIRQVVYQMDFFLPDGSKMLYARMRIVNPTNETVPMYWWSNIALPEIEGGRVIMEADDAYTGVEGKIGKVEIPKYRGIDVTYPKKNPTAVDYFWHIPDGVRKYECQVDKSGYGFIQTSTERLKGRKLFVWGQGPGGDRWQEYLSKEGEGGRYIEIQAGLGRTQYECVPMPPKTAWEWMETYGAIKADGKRTHGRWTTARREVRKHLEEQIKADDLEKLLRETHGMAVRAAEKVVCKGSGWGALENMRREVQGEEKMSEHLDFGETGKEQESWVNLLTQGFMDEHEDTKAVPESYMLQKEWLDLMENASLGRDEYNWYLWMQYGITLCAKGKYKEAKVALQRGMNLCENDPSPWLEYGMACALYGNGEEGDAEWMMRDAFCDTVYGDLSIAKSAMKLLIRDARYNEAIEFRNNMPTEMVQNGRIELYSAKAYYELEEYERAGELLEWINVADIQEGETSITELWYDIAEAKAFEEGEEFDRERVEPPVEIDFRMNAVKAVKKGKTKK